jgi:hypothetical protein
MAFYIYNDPTLLPPTGPIEGDEAFVVSNNKGYIFTDLSSILSYSYAFSQAGSLIADNSLSSLSDNTFSIDFWSYTQTSPDRSYFTFDAKNKITTINEVSRSLILDSGGGMEVLSTSPFQNAYSLYFDGDDNVIKIDDGATNIGILKPYTIEFWGRSTNSTPGSIFNLRDEYQGITSIEKNKIVYNGVDFTFNTPSHVFDSWEHHAISFDGFDHRYFNNGKEINTTISSKNSFPAGNLSIENFVTNHDAGFQFKTLVPSSITDGNLFSLGEGSLGTSLTVSGGGNTLTLSAKDLTISTSTFPKDSNEHVFSWDYRINPKRIRLFIDGDLAGSSSLSSTMTNEKWAEGTSINVDEFIVDANDVQELPYYAYYGIPSPGSYYSINPFTRVENGNFYFNHTNNRFYVFATINGPNSTLINPNGNKIYYFEYYPVGSLTTSPSAPFIVSRQSSLINSDLFYAWWFGSYVRSYVKNQSGLSINRLNHYYYATVSRINSIIIDEVQKKIYNFSNGRLVGTDDFSSSNMITPDTFALGFQLWDYNNYRQIPDHETKVAFNRNDWIFDPSELYQRAVASVLGPTGEFAGNSSPAWFSNNVSDLRYYTQTFQDEYTSVSVGSKIYDTTYDRTGLQYAQQYITSTGGSIVTYSGGTDITSTIASLNNGDALVLPPGSYTAIGVREGDNHSTIFGGKNILICGQTNNPSDVLIEYSPDETLRDTPIFGRSSNRSTQIAYLTFKRLGNLRTGSYQIALFQNGRGGKAYRTVFDFNNKNISWLYESYWGPQIKRSVIECVFKNYNNWYTYYNGSIRDLFVIDCKFSKDFRDQTSVNMFGQNETYCTFVDNTSRNLEFEGYLYDVSLSSASLYDSDFNVPSKKIADPNTEILIEQDRRGENLINLRADGKLVVNDIVVDSINYPLRDWIHHAVSYDDSTLRIYKDGNLVSSLVTDLEGFTLDNSILKIGRDDRLNTVTAQYDNTYYTGNLKDISFKGSLVYDSSTYSVPTEDKLSKDSADIFFTGGKEPPPGDVNLSYEGTGISNTLFSPYTEATKGWIPSFLVSPAYTSVSVGTVNGTSLHLFDFDSSTFFDSNISFELYIKMTETDDLAQSIGWNYEFMIPNQTVKIARRGDNEFLIKRNYNSSFQDYSDYNSSLYITSFKTDSPDVPGTFAPVPQVSDRSLNEHGVVIQYDRLFTFIDTTLSPIPLRMISQIDLIDSTFDETGFVYDSVYDYDILNNDRHIRIFDSLGALPI